ncbi:MAG TPA: hypothetical protein VNT99_20925 [Methylomirabilota bacterium]|nr:hypothetical protein [Methylomirabilota bacterium]
MTTERNVCEISPVNGLQPTRLTLFVVVHLFGRVAGLIIGACVGLKYFQIAGLAIGAVVGFLLGHIVGYLPTWLGTRWMFRSIEKSATAELKDSLDQGEWNFWQTMTLLQLAARKENVQPYLPRILAMLESDETLTRVYGWDALRLVFTELSQRIDDYEPRARVEECRRKAALLHEYLAGLPS